MRGMGRRDFVTLSSAAALAGAWGGAAQTRADPPFGRRLPAPPRRAPRGGPGFTGHANTGAGPEAFLASSPALGGVPPLLAATRRRPRR